MVKLVSSPVIMLKSLMFPENLLLVLLLLFMTSLRPGLMNYLSEREIESIFTPKNLLDGGKENSMEVLACFLEITVMKKDPLLLRNLQLHHRNPLECLAHQNFHHRSHLLIFL